MAPPVTTSSSSSSQQQQNHHQQLSLVSPQQQQQSSSQQQQSANQPRRFPQTTTFPIRLPPSSTSFLRPIQMPNFTVASSVSPNHQGNNSINAAQILAVRDPSIVVPASDMPRSVAPLVSSSTQQPVSTSSQSSASQSSFIHSTQMGSNNGGTGRATSQSSLLPTRTLSQLQQPMSVLTGQSYGPQAPPPLQSISSQAATTRNHIQSVTQAFMHLRQYFADNYRQQHHRSRRVRGRIDSMASGSTSMDYDDDNDDVDGEDDDDQTNSDDSDECEEDSPPPQRRTGGTRNPRHNIQQQQQQQQQQRYYGIDPLLNSNDYPAAHSHFRYKIVCNLNCRFCDKLLCMRGMKAILLADTKVELYSTDTPPGGVSLVNDAYITENCRCRIHDVACLGCGNVVGYHVTQPCETCLDSCNNGHFWMFQMEGVKASERTDPTGTKPLLWAFLPVSEKDSAFFKTTFFSICR